MEITQPSTRLQETQALLRQTLEEIQPEDGNLHINERLGVFRRSEVSEVFHGESSLALCMIAEGAKQMLLGDEVYRYDKYHYLITAMSLPTASCIVSATPDAPYLSLKLELDPGTVRSVILSAESLPLPTELDEAFNVADVTADLLDAVVRLLRVSRNPHEAAFLAPLIEREIVYRLLLGNHGGRLSQVAGLGPTSQGITRALNRMRSEYDRPLRIPEIAQDCGMSVSSFHDHFKRATGLTPLQFQKNLRLREARRLLLSEDIDVANAGFRVGYNDASHFNRDYKKLFGRSPMRDVGQLIQAGPLATAPN